LARGARGHAEGVAFEPERWAVQAEPSQVSVARRRVGALARSAGMVEPAARDVELGVSEAVTNAVLHAFTGSGRPGTIELAVHVDVDGDALIVEVIDDGSGLRPRDDSPGAGFGLGLIRRLTRTMTLTRPPGGGLSLRMTFPLMLRQSSAGPLGRGVAR
jgi:serine/threonine-protein kinase RsbW